MKKVGKPVFFIVLFLIALLTYTSFYGVSTTFGDISKTWIKGADGIRWGIDIRGGVDVTFSPPEDVEDATDEQMAAATEIIKTRLVSQGITDYEVYTDNNKDRVIVRFPWKENETDFNPEKAIAELGETALLTFREGNEVDESGLPTGTTKDSVILVGADVESATPAINSETNESIVSLKLTADGTKKFAEATKRLASQSPKGVISIWMDDIMISYPSVNEEIPNGEAMISGGFTVKEAKALADKINSGALPFKLVTDNYNSISPTMGLGARDAMVLAGIIAFIAIAVFITSIYRLPAIIAVIGLAGQVAGMVASVSGYFPFINSFTLTLPGIAGIILSIGMGVDANIITAERIREELLAGRTLDASIDLGFAKGFTAIFDSNITVILVAVVLMGAFGPPSSIFAMLLSPLFNIFGPSTAGVIYSFGYTLLVGVIVNFIMGVTASRLMLKSISKFKPFRNTWLYGGAKK